MKEEVRRLTSVHGINLGEEEIELITRQAENARRLFHQLCEVDQTGVVPALKFDKMMKR